MSSEVGQLSKPKMRGLLNTNIKFNLGAALTVGVLGALAYKFLIAEPRKRKYAEFYKTYDPVAALERMRKAGHLDSAKPDN